MDLLKAEALACALIAEHIDPFCGEHPGKVRFEWHRRISALGTYSVRKHRTHVEGVYVYERKISLSRPMTEVCDEATVRETILHEVAHARAGISAGHGPMWAKECNLLGIEPKACGGSIGGTLPTPRIGVEAVCPVCSHKHWKPRRPSTPRACGVCRNRAELSARLLTWSKVQR